MPEPNTDPLTSIPRLNVADTNAYQDGQKIRILAENGSPGWIGVCVDRALNALHPFVRGEARIALQLGPPQEIVAALLPALTSTNRRIRRRAMTLLPRLNGEEVTRQIKVWLPSASKEGKRAACVALAAIGEPAAEVLRLLECDSEESIRRRARRALEVLAVRKIQAKPSMNTDSAIRPFGLKPPHNGFPIRQRSFVVAAFNFSYGVNLGVLIRSAEAAGAEAVWIVGRDFYYRPSTKGSDWWLPVDVLSSAEDCIYRAKSDGLPIVALQQGESATSIYEMDWPQRPLIVVGNEGDGLPKEFIDAADFQLTIPIFGNIDSLNVAVAASIAMYGYLGYQKD